MTIRAKTVWSSLRERSLEVNLLGVFIWLPMTSHSIHRVLHSLLATRLVLNIRRAAATPISLEADRAETSETGWDLGAQLIAVSRHISWFQCQCRCLISRIPHRDSSPHSRAVGMLYSIVPSRTPTASDKMHLFNPFYRCFAWLHQYHFQSEIEFQILVLKWNQVAVRLRSIKMELPCSEMNGIEEAQRRYV